MRVRDKLGQMARAHPTGTRVTLITVIIFAIYLAGATHVALDPWAHNVGLFGTLLAGLTHPLSVILVLMVIAGLILTTYWLMAENDNVEKEGSVDTSYGRAHRQTYDEMKKNFLLKNINDPDCTETLFGFIPGTDEVVMYNPETPGNEHCAIISASGDGKTTGVTITKALQCIKAGDSFLMTDGSGEAFKFLYQVAKDAGYVVRKVDYLHPSRSDGFDVFQMFAIEHEAIKAGRDGDLGIVGSDIADYMAANASKEDGYFTDETKVLFQWLLTYVYWSYQGEGFEKVIEIVSMSSLGVDNLIDGMGKDNPAYPLAKAWRGYPKPDKDRQLRGASVWLKLLYTETFRKLTSRDDVDFRLPGKEKCAYFLTFDLNGPSEEKRIFEGLFLNFMIASLMKEAQENKSGALDRRMYFILDEAQNAVTIPKFRNIINNSRKHRINFMLPVQSLQEFLSVYGKEEAMSIFNACSVIIFQGTHDPDTVDYIHKLASSGTYIMDQVTRDYLSNLPTTARSTPNERSAMPEDFILHPELPRSQTVFIHKQPLTAELDVPYFRRHPLAAKIKEVNPMDYRGWRIGVVEDEELPVKTSKTPPADTGRKNEEPQGAEQKKPERHVPPEKPREGASKNNALPEMPPVKPPSKASAGRKPVVKKPLTL